MSTGVAELREKYALLVVLREQKARGEASAPEALRELAARFPGALRELDRAPMWVLLDRLAALRGGPPPPWVAPTHRFHALLRAALAVRRAAGPGRDQARAAAAIALEGLSPRVGRALLRPAGGRLSEWAIREISREMKRPGAEVEALIWGHLHRGSLAPRATRSGP